MSDGAQAPWGPARHSWGLQPDPTAGSRPLHQPPGATQAQALCPGSCHLGQGPPFASETDSCGLWEGVLGTEMQVTDDNGWPSARVLPPSLCPLLGGLRSCPLGSGAAPSPELTLGGLSRPDASGRPLGCGARRPRCLRWPRPPAPACPACHWSHHCSRPLWGGRTHSPHRAAAPGLGLPTASGPGRPTPSQTELKRASAP